MGPTKLIIFLIKYNQHVINTQRKNPSHLILFLILVLLQLSFLVVLIKQRSKIEREIQKISYSSVWQYTNTATIK